MLPRLIFEDLVKAKATKSLFEGELLEERSQKESLIKENVLLDFENDVLLDDKTDLSTKLENSKLETLKYKTEVEVQKSQRKWFFGGGVLVGILASIGTLMALGG